jgi:predicted transcriptional regulator
MAIMTHPTTFALDEPTARRLKRLAARWQVSQAEVVRRSLEQAEQAEVATPDIEARIAAARRLRERLQARKVDVTEWMRTARASRR